MSEFLHFNWNRKVVEEVCGGRTCEFALQNFNASAKDITKYQAWGRLPLKKKRMGRNSTRNGTRNGMGLVFKVLLITIHEWQMWTDDIAPNRHEQYLQFTLCHYCSDFINEISLLNLVHTIKHHHFLFKISFVYKQSHQICFIFPSSRHPLIKFWSSSLEILGWNLKDISRDLWMHFAVEPWCLKNI